MRYLFRRLVVFLLVIAFVTGFLAYRTMHWERPELPRTELSGLGLSTYVYSARKLSDASPANPVSVSFSPEETSFLVENVDFSLRSRGFRLEGVHLRGAGEDIRIMMVLRGPLGFYYRSDFTGILEYDSEGNQWSVTTSSWTVGPIPIGYFLPHVSYPDWPRTIGDGLVRVRDLRLDGKGLRMTVTDVNLDPETLLD